MKEYTKVRSSRQIFLLVVLQTTNSQGSLCRRQYNAKGGKQERYLQTDMNIHLSDGATPPQKKTPTKQQLKANEGSEKTVEPPT